jgi:hypothetical protein
LDVVPFPKRRPELGDLLTPAELARRWSVCRDSIYRLPPEVLPFIRIGTRRRYRLSDVLDYEAKHLDAGDNRN